MTVLVLLGIQSYQYSVLIAKGTTSMDNFNSRLHELQVWELNKRIAGELFLVVFFNKVAMK
jgi:hypothetical protein